MDKEVSIVLSRERSSYRKLAQEWYGLTDEQMKECDVHHNPPRSQGGRNIPEHLFVYHYTLHAAVHEASFIFWGREAMKRGVGIHGATPEQRSVWSREAGLKAMQMGVGCTAASSEQLAEWSRMSNGSTGRKMKEEGRGIFAPGMQALGGKTTQERGAGVFALTKEQQRELGRRTCSQVWECLKTGHRSTPGGLSRWQKARGVDTSLRRRVS